MNIIYERTGIRYHEVHIYRLLHKWDFSPKVPRERFVNTASNEEKKYSKKTKEIISSMSKDLTVAVEDGSIFVHDTMIRKMWAPKGKSPIVCSWFSSENMYIS